MSFSEGTGTTMKTETGTLFHGSKRDIAAVAREARKVWTTPRIIGSELCLNGTENIAGIGGDTILSSS